MQTKITIVDYGVGNLASVKNMLVKVGANAVISSNFKELLTSDKIVLPGVGHFDHGMKMLKKSGLISVLNSFALEMRKPLLGICLGAQILGLGSEEGYLDGLGWIKMHCCKFPETPSFLVPHMGWNTLNKVSENPLLDKLSVDARFYFVHSFFMKCSHLKNVYANTPHGIDFSSVVGTRNIYGTQFHPEKSLRNGMNLLDTFVRFC
jgi:glutamine amidotransferase